MPSLKRMKKMNYAEAWEFFMKEKRMGSLEATDYLKYISRKSFVYDMRGKEITFDELYKGGWLIILDGVSCSGKSTTAKKIADYFITSGIDVYFDEYDTTVHFISEEELKRDHSGIPHGGFVIRSGKTGWNDENNHVIEYSLKLDSNPEFTSSVLVAYARAAYRMNKEGQSGAKTVFDVAPAYLCAADGAELRKHLL